MSNTKKIRRYGKNCDNSDIYDVIKVLLVKVSKIETDMAWVKKIVYAILGILLSLVAKIILGG
ncbi:MAG: hypothetical protein QXW34_02210 [Candidatus Methanomethyliaceae archaeon]